MSQRSNIPNRVQNIPPKGNRLRLAIQPNPPQRGQVRCGRIPHYRSQEVDKTHPKIPGFTNINVTSGNRKWRGLSPMILGPFRVIESRAVTPYYPDGLHPGFTAVPDNPNLQQAIAQNMENWWQYSKIYNVDLNQEGEIQPSFFQRRAEGFADPKPHRRAMPKKKGHVVAAYFDTQVYGYVPSRKFYCSTYEFLVTRTPEYQELQNRLTQGENLHIVGYDGKDIPVTTENFRAAYLDPNWPFGHELVLTCLLAGIPKPWIQD